MFKTKKISWIQIFVAAVFIILGIAAGAAAYIQMTEWNSFKLTAVETQGTITNIRKEIIHTHSGSKRRSKTKYTVTVAYTVEGKQYKTTLGYHIAGMREGQNVTIYYDPAHPDFTMTKPYIFVGVAGSLGVIFLIVGIFVIINEIKNHFYIKRLMAQNQYVICNEWTTEKSNLTVNGVRYHQINCRYVDERGREYHFTSNPFHPNAFPFTEGRPVKVYVDIYTDAKRYFVTDEI